MKRSLFTSILFALSISNVQAQSDDSMVWALTDVNYDEYIGKYLALDISFGTNYIAVNGIIEFEGSTAVNVTGTCFPSGAGVFCNVSLGTSTATLTIDGSLAGVVRIFDPSGNLASIGAMTPPQ